MQHQNDRASASAESASSERTEPRGPVDASVVPRFAGIATFARLPRLDEVGRADVAVAGVPFDSGVSYRPGARFGPSHVREASRLLRPYNPAQDVSPFASQQVADKMRNTDLVEPYPRLKAYYARALARPAWERTLALYAERFGVPVADIR